MSDIASLLEHWTDVVSTTAQQLRELSDDAARRRPAPGKWSVKEIVGHLVDSATHNHRRFVLAQLQDAMVFPGYAQDRWVALQAYQEAPWPALVDAWDAMNRQLAFVVSRIPNEVLHAARYEHNLDEIAWEPVAREHPVTLDYFVRDYVGHLEHHVWQMRRMMA